MQPTPDGERPPGPGRPAAPTSPPGFPHHPGPPPFTPAAPPWPSPPPPPRRNRSPVVWVAVAAAALTSLAAFTACAVLMVPASPPGPSTPAAADPARHTSTDFAARPAPVEIDVADHPLYALPVPDPVECSLPDVDAGSADSWVAFDDALSDCLTRLWRPRLEELGVHSVEPEFRVSRTKPKPLGSVDPDHTLAFYDGGQRMTVTLVQPNVVELARNVPAGYQQSLWVALLAHEYGHHVQRLAGILPAGAALEREAATEDERMQATRRIELQAECLAGVALRGLDNIGDAEIDRLGRWNGNAVDTATHGTGSNISAWFATGTGGDDLGACNTFDAPRAEVE
ncbi:hypothetical protein LP52_02090 [Streptomonospora alba]|uniref:Metalloprotease n=1 Tax=Streptomonospora alba TaxID=183763 RepID=A0A0C2JTW4_9ACTN|nr:neutral zinc metallopeptidase [Streptomonospora alba]KII00363.1 hypothetical protein LP52_02090 [Streptomonospora alba]